MARICNQSLLAQLPASFSWKRTWGDPDLEGILEVKMIDMLYPSEAHSAKPKLFALGDAKSSTKWKRMRLSLRGTDLQFRDPDPPFALQAMHVLVPGSDVKLISEPSETYIRIVLPADKVEIQLRRTAAPSISPRNGAAPRPISPRTTPTSESPLSAFSGTSLSGSPRFAGFSSNSSLSSASAFLNPPMGPTDSIDDWMVALQLAPAVGHVRYLVEMTERIKTELLANIETIKGKDFQHVAMRHAALIRARQLVSSLSDATLREKLPHIVDGCLLALADVETSQEPHIVAVLSYVPPMEKPRALSPRGRGSGPERKVAPPKDDAADNAFMAFLASLVARDPPALSVERRNGHISLLPSLLFAPPLSGITRLVLAGNTLSTLPVEIGELRALEFLDVRDNYLITLPQEIGLLQNLKVLILSGNPIEILPVGITLLHETTTIEGIQGLRFRTSLKLTIEQLDYLPRAISAIYSKPSAVPCLCGSPIAASTSPPVAAFVQTQSWRNREHLFWAASCRREEHTPNVFSILHQVSIVPPHIERKPSDKGLLSEALDSLRQMKMSRGQGSSGGSVLPVRPDRSSSSGTNSSP